MAAKQGIRVIKYNQRSRHSDSAAELAAKSEVEVKDLTREVAATVSSWVSEYRQRNARSNAALRFEMLFREPAITQATS